MIVKTFELKLCSFIIISSITQLLAITSDFRIQFRHSVLYVLHMFDIFVKLSQKYRQQIKSGPDKVKLFDFTAISIVEIIREFINYSSIFDIRLFLSDGNFKTRMVKSGKIKNLQIRIYQVRHLTKVGFQVWVIRNRRSVDEFNKGSIFFNLSKSINRNLNLSDCVSD